MPVDAAIIARGVRWLRDDQNEDGGFGDADGCPANISTTTLAWASLLLHGETDAAARAAAWLGENGIPERSATVIADAISRKYGEDRTFSVPILTHCALSGAFGEGAAAWAEIPALPFELAAFPRSLFAWLGLPVVSYALPALIAIGVTQHHHRPSRNPFARVARAATRRRTLRVLEAIQPASGGFLEAAPLTSFVTMSLAGCGEVDHPVARAGVRFLLESVRDDGSWPIDTNLATWVSTLSIQALGADAFEPAERDALRAWLLGQQLKAVHPYTGSAPGGWAWTDLSGGVPDADDTPGALLALRELRAGDDDREVREAAVAGVRWLLDLQNRDGGMPTFCRGWGKLPFDRSSPDLTAHALRAWRAWRAEMPDDLVRRVDRGTERAVRYLLAEQRDDGSWVPLWFGNPWTSDQANPVYGTARVLQCGDLIPEAARRRAVDWLLGARGEDGGWGTIEETALAVTALADALADPDARAAGIRWLADRTAGGRDFPPAPIGLYFASLWYSERLYPLAFTVGALDPTR